MLATTRGSLPALGGGGPWKPGARVEVEQDEEFVVTITLPNQSTDSPADPDGPYVNENCIYTIDAIYTAFQFTGVLDPYYVPLNTFIPYTTAPLSDPITWARLVYLTSQEVEARMGDNAEWLVANRPEALKNFTKYLILAMTSGVSSNESFMLGELQISAGMSITNRGNVDFASMMDLWEAKLFGYGLTVRSVDVVAPRADTYFPRSKLASKWAERRYGTFDRRIL